MIKLNFNPTLLLRKEFFQKKSVRFLFDVMFSLIGLIFLLFLLTLGRLSMGPINLDFLTPDVESALNSSQKGFKGTVEHTQLVWRKWYRPFEIELVNVKLQTDQKPDWIKIEHIGVSLKLYKLFLGDVSLRAIRIYRPHLLLERDKTGQFLLGFGDNAPNKEFSFEDFAPLLTLEGSSSSFGKLDELTNISIIDAYLELKDDLENQTWQLPKTSLVLKRLRHGFTGELTLQPQNAPEALILSLSHSIDSKRIDFKAKFRHVSLNKLFENKEAPLCEPHSEITTLDDLFNFLQCWNIPLNGKIHLAFNPITLEIIDGDCEVDLGKGTLDLSLTKFRPLPITSGNLSLTLTPDKVHFERAAILSDEMLIHLMGELDSSAPLTLSNFLSSGQQLDLQGKVEDLSLDHLAALWPEEVAHHARRWITNNLRKGILSEVNFSLKGHGEENGFFLDDLKGEIEGENAEVTFLEGLPPAQNVHAHATFDSKGFDIKIHSGELKTIKVEDAKVLIKDLDTDNESLELDLKAKGLLSDFLEVLNYKPLEYASYGGIDPKKAKGEGHVNLKMNFPLLADLKFKHIKMTATGALNNVALERKITEGITAQLTKGSFSLNLTQDQMKIQGKGLVNQLPSQLSYEHFFKKGAPYELQMKVDATTTFEDVKKLGFDVGEYGQGSTNTSLTYTLGEDKKSHFFVDLDLTPALISIAPLDWHKKPGEKGQISFGLLFENGTLSKMQNLKMVSSPYSLQGEIEFDSQRNWKSIHLSEFKGPHINTQATFKRPQQNAYEISFEGESVDLENFLKYLDQKKEETHHTPIDIKLSANVNQLRLGEKKIFEKVKSSAHLVLQGDEKIWKSVHLRAQAGKGTAYKGDMAQVSGGILFDIKPGPGNIQTLEVRANDAGKFLKNLSIYDQIHRGYLTIKAEREGQGPFKGVFKIKSFEAQSVPILARFAAVLSPMGIVNLFSEKQTLSLERFECNFEYGEDAVVIKNGIGKSMSLGFTSEGKLDRINRLFSLSGNVIPARFINSVLSNIPLIGSLLNGGKGEGLIAFAYTVKGSFDEPDVSVNPLSALAPGFIRKIFQSLGSDEE